MLQRIKLYRGEGKCRQTMQQVTQKWACGKGCCGDARKRKKFFAVHCRVCSQCRFAKPEIVDDATFSPTCSTEIPGELIFQPKPFRGLFESEFVV